MLSLFLESHGEHKFPEEDDKIDSGIPKMGTCSGGRQIPFNIGKQTADGMKIDLNDIKNAQYGSCGGGIPADAFESKKKEKKKSTKKKSKSKKVDVSSKTPNEQKEAVKAPVAVESEKNKNNEADNKDSQPKQETKDEL
jgi:hypothetical protein